MEAGLKLQPELCLLRNGHGNAQLCRHIVTAPQVGAVCLLRYSAPVGNPFEGSVQICHCRKLLTSVTPLQKAFKNGGQASYPVLVVGTTFEVHRALRVHVHVPFILLEALAVVASAPRSARRGPALPGQLLGRARTSVRQQAGSPRCFGQGGTCTA